MFSHAGDCVYLQPAEPGLPLYIARIEDLLHLNPPTTNHEPLHAGEQRANEGTLAATVAWFYRLQERDWDAPLPVFENEVFMADEHATHPLESGKHHVETLLEWTYTLQYWNVKFLCFPFCVPLLSL